MQVFSLLADWHRCSSTHHRCPSANNHVANDSSVWQTVPSWFLWYLWASLSLVLAESRWDFNFVACSCGLAVSSWHACSWWARSLVSLLMVWDYFNTENDVLNPQAVLYFESMGGVLCSEFRSLLESSVWCCYCMKFHWIKVLPWWRWKSRDWSWWREKGKCWCVRQILGNLIFPNTNGEGKEASYVRVYFNVQLSVVMKVDKTGFTEPWLCRICCKGSDI